MAVNGSGGRLRRDVNVVSVSRVATGMWGLFPAAGETSSWRASVWRCCQSNAKLSPVGQVARRQDEPDQFPAASVSAAGHIAGGALVFPVYAQHPCRRGTDGAEAAAVRIAGFDL